MDSKKLFEKYYSRLAHEGMLKALLCGIVVGFAVDFVIALVTWFIPGFELGYAIALGVGLLVVLIATVIFYYKAFKPTTKKIARRIDSLGLEERLITMTELENDESFIAMRQREDAKAKLSEINSKSIKFIIARSLIIAAVVVGVVGLSMTTVNALAAAGVLPSGIQLGNQNWDDPVLVMVSYTVDNDEAGWIDGEADQLIEVGGSTTEVTAVANEGWVFIEWAEDKSTLPARSESGVVGDMTFVAVFQEMSDGSGGDDNGPSDSDDVEPSPEPPEKTDDTPPDSNNSNNNNNPPSDPTDGTGRFLESNKIKDGEKPYQDDYDATYREAMDKLLNDSNLSADEKAMMEEYFKQLQAGTGYGGYESSDGSN